MQQRSAWAVTVALTETVAAHRALRKADAERVPLGLIRSSWGGTKIREWSSAAAIAECTQAVPAPPGTTTKLFANMILPLVGLNFKAVTW